MTDSISHADHFRTRMQLEQVQAAIEHNFTNLPAEYHRGVDVTELGLSDNTIKALEDDYGYSVHKTTNV